MIDALNEAATHMKAPLQLLDEADVPADIGAHLDLAISRAEELLQRTSISDDVEVA